MAGCRSPFTESTLTALAGSLVARGHMFEFKHAKSWKTRNLAAPKTHHEIHSSPATATTSRRRPTKHVPRVSPCSPASIDPGSVEIGLVQLSQSIKTTNVTHTQTDRQAERQTDRQTDRQTHTDRQTNRHTDNLNNCALHAPRYDEAFFVYG